jgi:RimJ/RimL family protein N-acetyltransferase
MDVVLETDRLLLRQFRNEDLDAYAAICADPEVMRYLGTGATLNRVESWRQMAGILGHWKLLGCGMFAMEIRETGELIGRTGYLTPPDWPGFELGWTLGRAWWGKGYAVEAAIRCRDYAFDEMGRDRLISLIRPGNHRSVRVAEKIGETLAGEVEFMGSNALVYEIRKR